MNNPFEIIKQMGMMQGQLKTIEEEIKALRATGESGAGLVSVELDGTFRVASLKIDDSLWSEDNRSMAPSLIASAFNSANDKIRELTKEKSASLASSLMK